MDRTATQLPARPLDGPNSAPLSLSLSHTHRHRGEARTPQHRSPRLHHLPLFPPRKEELRARSGPPVGLASTAEAFRAHLRHPPASHSTAFAHDGPTLRISAEPCSTPFSFPPPPPPLRIIHPTFLLFSFMFFFFFFLIPGEGFIFSNILQFFKKILEFGI